MLGLSPVHVGTLMSVSITLLGREEEKGAEDVYIITTKAAEFTCRLLAKQSLFGEGSAGGGIVRLPKPPTPTHPH